jgi:broad specificity phosphatase PhoE
MGVTPFQTVEDAQMPVTIWLATHSNTEASEAGLAAGLIDTPLSVIGHRQALELRDRYGTSSGIHIDAVVTAALARARQTAAIAFEGLPLVITADARLNECDYGNLSGRPRVEIDSARLAHIEVPWPGGESYTNAVTRHRAAFDDIGRERPGGTVLVVGHYATWMALEHLAGGRPLADVAVEERAWQPGWRYEYRGSGGAA